MRKTGTAILFTLLIFTIASVASYAQLRENLNSENYTGPVVKQEQDYKPGDWSNLFNMKMSHSYSMNFMSYGGQYQNINAYTNTMDFFFSERLHGRLDISLLHSPFGNSYLNSGNDGMGAEIIIRNAELNYQLSENSHLSIQFQQHPYSPFGPSPFGNYGYNPFDRYGYSRY